MDPEKFQADPAQIKVDKQTILSLLGQSGQPVDQYARELVETYISRCIAAASPKGAYLCWDSVPLESGEDVVIDGERFRVGRIIIKELKNATAFIIFAVTAGPGPETLARELMGLGNYLEGFIADLVGSAIVEWAADQIHMIARTKAVEKGMKVTNRYSPGYCSWKVNEQQKLFRLIPPEQCGITLSDSSLMIPVKSASGMIGIGTGVTFNEYPCEVCPMKNCKYRKTRTGSY
jgi:hypothetical protein